MKPYKNLIIFASLKILALNHKYLHMTRIRRKFWFYVKHIQNEYMGFPHKIFMKMTWQRFFGGEVD